MAVIFWSLQILLAMIVLVPTAVAAASGWVWVKEFAIVIVPALVWLAGTSGFANWLRVRGRPGTGTLVLLFALVPFGLLVWFVIGLAKAFSNG